MPALMPVCLASASWTARRWGTVVVTQLCIPVQPSTGHDPSGTRSSMFFSAYGLYHLVGSVGSGAPIVASKSAELSPDGARVGGPGGEAGAGVLLFSPVSAMPSAGGVGLVRAPVGPLLSVSRPVRGR